jgi:hypothetical protein
MELRLRLLSEDTGIAELAAQGSAFQRQGKRAINDTTTSFTGKRAAGSQARDVVLVKLDRMAAFLPPRSLPTERLFSLCQ